MKDKPKIVVVVGPTAVGKSDLGVALAKKFNGEVISADSRQVYKGMNIGSGKITKREMQNIPHHLLDVASPKRDFTVTRYQKLAHKAIRDILSRGKLPIVVGGTGLYIDSIVDNPKFPNVKPNNKLRKQLEKLTVEELQQRLAKLDPERAASVQTNNKRRLIRAIEIAKDLGKVPKVKKEQLYETFKIGLTIPLDDLEQKISKRLHARISQGMIAEVKKLHHEGLSFKRLHNFGLEYRFIANFLEGKLSKEDMSQKIITASRQYAKRQMTWFKRDTNINWFKPGETSKITKEIKLFLEN